MIKGFFSILTNGKAMTNHKKTAAGRCKLGTARYYFKAIGLSLALLAMAAPAVAQPDAVQEDPFLDEAVLYEVKRRMIKYKNVLSAHSGTDWTSRGHVIGTLDWRSVKMIGFGYAQELPELQVERFGPQPDLPGTGYRLYLASFPRSLPRNERLYSFFQRKAISLLLPSRALFAVNAEKELLFVSQNNWNQLPLAGYFNLDPEDPSSYLPFLKARYYSFSLPSISFEYRERRNDTLIFDSTRELYSGWKFDLVVSVPIGAPESLSSVAAAQYPPGEMTREDSLRKAYHAYPEYDFVPFASTQEKVDYLKGALMDNLYMWNFNHKKLADSLRAKPASWDHWLPDYDERMPRLRHLRYGCCWEDKGSVAALKAKFPLGTEFIFGEEEDWLGAFAKPRGSGAPPPPIRVVVGEKRRYHGEIEFYKFFLDSKYMLLERVKDEQFPSLHRGRAVQAQRYDRGYQPEIYEYLEATPPDMIERMLANIPDVPGPFSAVEDARYLSVCNTGHSWQDTVHGHYYLPYASSGGKIEHYLLALNTETKDVYFVSGDNIYLSYAIELYVPKIPAFNDGERELNQKGDNFRYLLYDQKNLLAYLQDRLYSYGVERLEPEHIVYQDLYRIRVECKGRLPGKGQVGIRASMEKLNSEWIDVNVTY